MKAFNTLAHTFTLAALLLAGHSSLAAFSSGPEKELKGKDLYEFIEFMKGKVQTSSDYTDALRRIEEVKSRISGMVETVEEGKYQKDAQRKLEMVDARYSLLEELDGENLQGSIIDIRNKLKNRPTEAGGNGNPTRYDEVSSIVGGDRTPLKISLSPVELEDGSTVHKLSLSLDENIMAKLERYNPDLHTKLKGLSDEELKKVLEDVVEDLEESNEVFSKSFTREDVDAIAENIDGQQEKFVAAGKAAEEKLEEIMTEIENVDRKGAQHSLNLAMSEGSDIVDALNEKADAIDMFSALLEDDAGGLKAIKETSSCEFFAATGVFVDELSDAQRRKCRKEVAANLFKKKEIKSEVSDESSAVAESKSEDNDEVADEEEEDTAIAAARKKQEEEEAAKRMVAQQAAMDRGVLERQVVANSIVPMACSNQSVNNSLPFAGDPANAQRLDNLEQAMASQMTACKTTGFVDSQMEGFGSAFPLASGEMLATDALSTVYPRGPAQMTAEEAKELSQERKCLARSAQAMRRGLVLTKLEIEKQARNQARQKLFSMRAQNPIAYSQELMRKQAELQMMGRLTPFTNEEDLSQELYNEYRTRFEGHLAEERKLLQKENELRVVQVLGTEVNNMYNDRVNFVTNQAIRPSTQSIVPGVSRPAAPSRRAPSRRTPSSGGSSNNPAQPRGFI